MPRLTNREYLARRELLKDAWRLFQGVYVAVSYNQQMAVHAFFQPSKDLTDEEALEHRRTITVEEPSLPNRAGKGYLGIERAAYELHRRLEKEPSQDPTLPVRLPKNMRTIKVAPIARPEVDVERLAEALLDLAEEVEEEKREPEFDKRNEG